MTHLERTGMAGRHLLNGRLPGDPQKRKGPYAVIECFEEIPCNPCVMSCKFDAILPFKDINDLPFVDFDRCTGCAVCARICPGLAIFIVDESKDGSWGTIRLPCEYWPLPAKGDLVQALARDGSPLGKAEVTAVQIGAGSSTPLVTLAVRKDQLQDVRGLRLMTEAEIERDLARETGQAGARLDEKLVEKSTAIEEPQSEVQPEGETAAAAAESPNVCRCEGVSLAEIHALIAAGYHTIDEIKQMSRAGMGPCQGRTCRQIITSELIRAGVAKIDHLDPGSFRPPGGTVTLGQLAEGGVHERDC